PTEQMLDRADIAERDVLEELASAPHLDLVGKATLWKLDHALATATPKQVQDLLRADSPNLRAFVWIWLARTRRGGCILTHFDPAWVEAAVFERSLVVELGNELLMRPVSHYALAARARLIAGKPGSLDRFLHQLAGTKLHATRGRLHPLIKASAHAILIRRGLLDQVDAGLVAREPSVRAAVGLALLESDPDLHEHTVLRAAATDPVDLVTEALVEKVLRVRGVLKNPESVDDQIPLLTGALAETDDPRLVEAVARWFGHGDPLAALPRPRPQAKPQPEPEAISEVEPPLAQIEATPDLDPPPANGTQPVSTPATPGANHLPSAGQDLTPTPSTAPPASSPAPRLPGVTDEP
ncbi:MAG: hypothetical protein ACPG4T_09415, partial [Nannocystaceae bacterium]